MRQAILLFTLASVTVLSCARDGTVDPPGDGLTRVLLTDAPFPFDQVSRVDVHIVSVAAASTADTIVNDAWITLAEPGTTFNLLDLQDGTTTLLGEAELAAGVYQAVRVVIDADQSSITMNDGSQAVVDWQIGGIITLHAFVEDQLDVPVEGARIVIDFDVGRSFLPVASGFLFIPWIRAVNEAATGSVAGTVRGSDGPSGVLSPVPNASVGVYRSNSTGVGATPVATGRTDDLGQFFIPFVTEGSYAVQAYPPAGFDAGRAIEGGVFVIAGDETTVDLTLPPDDGPAPTSVRIQGKQSIVVGESVGFFAYVTGETGDSVSTPLVQWMTSDSRVASISGSGQAIIVTGNAPGLALILATSMGAADSVLVSVGLSDTSPVETVELTPLTQTINVGDSTVVQAILRDANGQILAGRGIDWSITEAAVVSYMISFSGDFVVLTGLAPGTASITATSEGKSGSGTVVVK